MRLPFKGKFDFVMLKLEKWASYLRSKPETGMDYWVASVILQDGRRFDQVAIDSGYVLIRGRDDVPFVEVEIAEIIITHDKWDFKGERQK